ncbi:MULTISPECIES: hypothetical protein [Bacillus cereus group]|uniref:hypothetical protein n=1 Tax=Bacillus cereus group TaxID=86661 RepID=UPI001F5AEF5F|nr:MULTISPECIES: hypothetical protein [Bacillus cereus group]MDW3038319.1 hypothetical protein [Bacillus pacificus]
MIDTMYITWEFTKREYGAAVNALGLFLRSNSLSPIHKKKGSDNNALITYGLAKYGFEEIRLRNNKKHGYRAMEILLRPKLLVDAGNYNNVTHLHEFVTVRHQFNYILRNKIGLVAPDLFCWKVKRVDDAIDLKVDEQLLSRYMFLFKKGNLPNYMCNSNSLQYFDAENNVYIGGNITINWYDRYLTQCIKQRKTKKQYNNLEELRGKFRLEIQTRDVRRYIKTKDNSVLTFLDIERTRKRIMYFYDFIVGSGTYYTYDQGMEIINKVSCQIQRVALRKCYELINREGSIWRARMKYIEMQPDGKKAADWFSKRLNQIRKLEVNPVALPSEWGISKLPNLREDILNYFKDYQEKQSNNIVDD